MTNIQDIEGYFDALLENKDKYNTEHVLADDKQRFEILYKIKSDLKKISNNLRNMSSNVNLFFPAHSKTISVLAQSYNDLAKISDQSFDNYLRTLVVENFTAKKQGDDLSTEQLFDYMIKGLMQIFFESGDKLADLTKKVLNDLKDIEVKAVQFYQKKQEEELRQSVIDTITTYEQVEHFLRECKNGLIAKDLKMLLDLKNIKFGADRSMLQALLDRLSRKGGGGI